MPTDLHVCCSPRTFWLVATNSDEEIRTSYFECTKNGDPAAAFLRCGQLGFRRSESMSDAPSLRPLAKL